MLPSYEDSKLYAKRVVKTALGRDHLTRLDVAIAKERYGTNYGGWVIAPHILERQASVNVLSLGIGDDISFDLETIRKFQATVFAFDPTPNSLSWLKTQTLPPEMRAYPIGVADYDGEQDFAFPDNPNWDDFSIRRESGRTVRCQVARISTIVAMCGIETADIVKLDIEGSEYRVIDDFCATTVRPGQFLVEFHHSMHGIKIAETLNAVKQLRSAGYLLFNLSPWGREFSFVHEAALRRA